MRYLPVELIKYAGDEVYKAVCKIYGNGWMTAEFKNHYQFAKKLDMNADYFRSNGPL